MANPFKKGGKGSLGEFDTLGNALDTVNPWLDDSDLESRERQREVLEGIAQQFNIPLPQLERLTAANPTWLEDLKASTIDGAPDVQYKDAVLERAKAETLDGTAFDSVEVDPRLREQQAASLGALKDLADRGGMSAKDEANLARMQNEVAQADRGRRDAIMQNMAARGMGGGGNELLATLQSSQAATDRAAQGGLDIAGMAQERALQAMLQGGQLAGQIRGQDFGEQSQIAAARDAVARFNAQNLTQNNQFNAGAANNMSQFNTGNQMQVDMFNTGNTLDTQKFNAGQQQSADQFNISGKQGVHNTGVANANDIAKYNANVPQQNFQNAVTLAQGKADAQKGIAGWHQQDAEQKEKARQDAIKGVTTVGSAIAASDERTKKDKKPVQEIDLEMFLASIQPRKFKYKDPAKHGEGDRTGVMAQDLLKSTLGREAVVQDDEGVLGYDKDKMQGIMLAALKHLSDKIDKKG